MIFCKMFVEDWGRHVKQKRTFSLPEKNSNDVSGSSYFTSI